MGFVGDLRQLVGHFCGSSRFRRLPPSILIAIDSVAIGVAAWHELR